MEPILLSVEAAAAALGLRRTKVYELMGGGRLRSVKVGKRRLLPAEALREFVASLEAEQNDD